MGARRAGLWRLHCSVFNLKNTAKRRSETLAGDQVVATAESAPLLLLKSDSRTFALHNQQLLQGGPELQHILLQAVTIKGGPPLKPRLSGSIDGTRFDLGDFQFFIGQARISERAKGDVFAVEYRPCLQWAGGYAIAVKEALQKSEQTDDKRKDKEKKEAPDSKQHSPKRPKLERDGADEKAPGLDKPSQTQTQTPAGQDSSFATTAASSAKVKSEPRVLKSESQNATSPATANRNGPTNIEHSKAKHNGTSTSASMAITCDELLDEIVGTICAAAPAAHPSVLGQDAKERESLGLADAMTDSRFAADGAEFHAVGLDEWQWSERHSALMFLSLFRGLS